MIFTEILLLIKRNQIKLSIRAALMNLTIKKKVCYRKVFFMGIIREEAKKVIEKLPDEASWDDVMYQMYVRKKIDEGIKAADKGKFVSHDEMKRKFSS
jgi:hypothetical protein